MAKAQEIPEDNTSLYILLGFVFVLLFAGFTFAYLQWQAQTGGQWEPPKKKI
eukprot:gene19749-26441_t